ncbi:MAG: malonate decarboxylase subunit alpha, partial [Bacillota bacterium]
MENRASRRTDWTRRQEEFQKRLRQAQQFVSEPGSKVVNPNECVSLLEAVIRPGDRVALEGNNQKQADFLAECLCRVDVDRVNDLHMVQSVIALPSHCEIFERGIARLADFSYSAPQSTRVARMVEEGKMKIGEIHTYLELFGRYFVDLTPDVALITAIYADGAGNLYTGPNTEDTPTIVEATKFRQGIVVAQVERVIDKLPRVDIPAEWVDFLVPVGRP